MVNSNKFKKIGIYYPCFMGGGAEAVALWMLEALKDKYDLTVFTFSDLEWEKLNTMYGTSINHQVVKIKSLLPKNFNHLSNFLISNNKNFRQLALHLTLRYLKAKQDDYDLLISAYNAADLAKPGIQYIHWIKVIEGGKLAKKFYNKISQFSEENIKKNLSIANSYTVAKAIKNYYGVEATVIYPPVVIKVLELPWEQKENAFICSGRLVKTKQPHKVIGVLKQVRQQGFDIKLYLTGGGGGVSEQDYKQFLMQMIKDNSSWVHLCENLSYHDYSQLLYRCKYGIHFKQEPFGISVAEMVKAGMIPFIKQGGGQVEIVGERNTELLFSNEQEAIEKIVNVLKNFDKQSILLESLNQQKNLFSTERFMNEISQLVDDYLK